MPKTVPQIAASRQLDSTRLGRNHLLGAAGDAMNALLVAAGHNLRLILNWLRLCVAYLMAALTISFAQSDTAHEPWSPIAA
jgi:transposase, IS5 family